MFSGWWRYVSLPDLLRILKANLMGSTGLFFYIILIPGTPTVPFSIVVLDFLLCFLIMSGTRIFTRMACEAHTILQKEKSTGLQRVLIVGAGAAGQTIAREIRQNPNLNKIVLGFLDHDSLRQGQNFVGVPVLGTSDQLEEICREHRIGLVIITQSATTGKELRSILNVCRKAGVESKILPTIGNIINGEVSVQNIRDVQVEDLLGRKPARLDLPKIQKYLAGKRILVTGAGGSIGSEICRQVAKFSPGSLILFENAETPLFFITRQLKEQYPELTLFPSLSDIRDRSRVEDVFGTFRPEVVFHAAAYKHVPMSEQNSIETIKNNVLGTRILADAAHAAGVGHFVMISTDKAVNPTGIMGASKRAAEIYIQSLARFSNTHMVTVRFGNVLESNGSVIPIFREQIKKGGPVTVTHPEVTRFFMTIPEAAQLVLQAGSMGKGGEIFLLDMGESIKIIHLAKELIRLSGLRPYEDIDIVFSGLRPGEKLYEELLLAEEGVMPTTHGKIRVLHAASHDETALKEQLERLYQATRRMDSLMANTILREIVPEFHPEKAPHQSPKSARLFPVSNTAPEIGPSFTQPKLEKVPC
ncbi:MAG: polysaccharide biosynthesis protein [Deltaproteobacteria bacterium]|nr:polysaccharide biosynthesis protein [Deltaproteobacteria bacterium]